MEVMNYRNDRADVTGSICVKRMIWLREIAQNFCVVTTAISCNFKELLRCWQGKPIRSNHRDEIALKPIKVGWVFYKYWWWLTGCPIWRISTGIYIGSTTTSPVDGGITETGRGLNISIVWSIFSKSEAYRLGMTKVLGYLSVVVRDDEDDEDDDNLRLDCFWLRDIIFNEQSRFIYIEKSSMVVAIALTNVTRVFDATVDTGLMIFNILVHILVHVTVF
jgi:hypothetical protein